MLDELERRAAAGAHVVDAIGEPELADRRRAVAAADDGERRRRRDRVGDRACARGERLELEHAHRAVPEDGRGIGDDAPRRHPRSRARRRAPSTRRGSRRPRRSRVSASAATSRAITKSTGICTRPVASSRVHSSTKSGSTSESPTDTPCARRKVNAIAPPTSTVSQRSSSASITPSLSPTLAPPSTATKGRARVVQQRREHLDLAEQQAPGRVRQQPRRADDRRVLTVRRAERVVHVEVAELARGWCRTPGRSLPRPARSAGSRASRRRPGSTARRPPPRAGRRPRARAAPVRRAARSGARRRDAMLYRASTLPFGRPRCPHTTTIAPVLAQVLDRREHGGDTEVVLDGAVVGERHVAVDAHAAPAARA